MNRIVVSVFEVGFIEATNRAAAIDAVVELFSKVWNDSHLFRPGRCREHSARMSA